MSLEGVGHTSSEKDVRGEEGAEGSMTTTSYRLESSGCTGLMSDLFLQAAGAASHGIDMTDPIVPRMLASSDSLVETAETTDPEVSSCSMIAGGIDMTEPWVCLFSRNSASAGYRTTPTTGFATAGCRCGAAAADGAQSDSSASCLAADDDAPLKGFSNGKGGRRL